MKFQEVKNPVHESETILPVRATKGSAGYDFYLKEDISLEPKEQKLTFTDVKCRIDEQVVLKLYPRSSLATNKGIVLTNTVGIIDSDYYSNPQNGGNIGLPLINTSEHAVTLKRGLRVAQGIFEAYKLTVDDKTNNERTGGFGSSGL